jgi:Fe-S oxidoreductase
MEFVSYGQVLNAFGDPMAWGTYMLRKSVCVGFHWCRLRARHHEEQFQYIKNKGEIMSESVKTESKDPIEERIEQLTPADLEKALQVFKEKIDHKYAAHLNSCVHCGLCADP